MGAIDGTDAPRKLVLLDEPGYNTVSLPSTHRE